MSALRQRGAASMQRRIVTTCAAGLKPLEDGIARGLRARLAALVAPSEATPRVAVVGRPSAEFAAALRAVRSAGASPAPIDVRRCLSEEVGERLAEARVQLAVVSASQQSGREEAAAVEAARRLGTPTASPAALWDEGARAPDPAADADASQGLAMLLLSDAPGGVGTARAAEVARGAWEARVALATRQWGLVADEAVLPLGLRADDPCAVVDAIEAPLAAKCRLVLPQTSGAPPPEAALGGGVARRSPGEEAASELWARVLAASEASVIFVGADDLRPFLDAYRSLARGLREELAKRYKDRAPRLSVALARLGTMPSAQVSAEWEEVFRCPLTWHFSCPEAGSLFSVGGASSDTLEAGPGVTGLEWRVQEDGRLRVRGEGLFSGYHGRPRSTELAFDEEGFFLNVGHRVECLGDQLRPRPMLYDNDIEEAMTRIMTTEPNANPRARIMTPEWEIKRVTMRKYDLWRTQWGAVLPTKKHNQAHKVYDYKYR